MALAVATITGKTGPGNTMTSVVLPSIKSLFFRIADGVLEVSYGNGQMAYFDYTQTVTVTDTISGVTSTFVVS